MGQSETGNYYYGARYYNPKISVWLSVDPLAHKYPSLSPYVFTGNNPIMLVDSDGRQIDPVLEKGAGSNGQDLLTLNVTGKIINFTGTDIDMEEALADLKGMVESSFSGFAEDGTEVRVNFDFEVAEDMNDVHSDDHLVVLAHGKDGDVPAGSNMMGGKVAVIDGDYFRGWYDASIGEEGERSGAHELGHLFGLNHESGNGSISNLMTQGPAWQRGNKINSSQFSHLANLKDNMHLINRGSNMKGPLPNLGPMRQKFSLRGTYGRQRRYVPQ